MRYLIGIGCGIFSYLLCMAWLHEPQSGQRRDFIKEALPCTRKKGIALLLYMVGAVLFALLFTLYGYGPVKIIRHCLLLGGLVPIGYEDYKEKRIPNRWLLALIIIRAILFGVESVLYPAFIWENVKFILFGAAVNGIILFLAYVISRHSIGVGDVKLFIVLGMYLGTGRTYLILLSALIIAACYGVVKVWRKSMTTKDEMAFAPFVAIGTVLILGLGF